MKTSTGKIVIFNAYNLQTWLRMEGLLDRFDDHEGDILLAYFNLYHTRWDKRLGRFKPTRKQAIHLDRRTADMTCLTNPLKFTYSRAKVGTDYRSIIDLCVVRNSIGSPLPLREYSEVLPWFDSDHRPVETVFKIQIPRSLRPRRLWDNVKWDVASKDLKKRLQVLPSDIADDDELTQFARSLVKAIDDCQNKFTPVQVTPPPSTIARISERLAVTRS